MTPPLFPDKMSSEKRVQKFHTDDLSLPRSGVLLLIGWSKFSARHWTNQEHYLDLGSWRVIGIEFLRSKLWRHFAWKPELTSRNGGCFLGLRLTVCCFHYFQFDSKGRNFLHSAIQNVDVETVLFLIGVSANVNSRIQDSSHRTPLHLAVNAGSEIIVRHLVSC